MLSTARRSRVQLGFALVLSVLAAPACVTQPASEPEGGAEHVVTVGQPEAAAERIAALTAETCGASWSLQSGDQRGSGLYVVSVFPEPTRGRIVHELPDAAAVQAFVDANADLLRDGRNVVGTYCEREGASDCHGRGALTCWLDVSRQVAALPDAARLARACNQKAIAKLDPSGVVVVEAEGGRALGSGEAVTGAALEACATARR